MTNRRSIRRQTLIWIATALAGAMAIWGWTGYQSALENLHLAMIDLEDCRRLRNSIVAERIPLADVQSIPSPKETVGPHLLEALSQAGISLRSINITTSEVGGKSESEIQDNLLEFRRPENVTMEQIVRLMDALSRSPMQFRVHRISVAPSRKIDKTRPLPTWDITQLEVRYWTRKTEL